MLFLLAALVQAPPAAEGEVDRIMLRFFQRREKARSPESFRALLQITRRDLETFLKDNPKHKDAERATFHVAESFLSEEEFDKGLAKLQDFLKEFPASPNAAAARFAIGEVNLQLEKDAAARTAFEEFGRLYPKDERALIARMYIAVTLQNEKKYDEATKILTEARQSHKDRPEAWSALMQLAVLYHVTGKQAEAAAALEEVVRGAPNREAQEIARRHLAEYLKVGKPAPAFVAKDTTGREQSIEKLRGRAAVLYFFDSSAQSSVAEAGFLRRVRSSVKEDDVEFLGISVDQEKRELAIFLGQTQLSWPVVCDGKGFDGLVPLLYGVRGLPSVYVLDRQGRIRFFNLAGRDLRNALELLAQEK